MDINIQFLNVNKIVTDKRDIRNIILKNGIQAILISDKNILNSSCSVAINKGYYSDDINHQGTAHFIEHLLFMGCDKYPNKNDFHSYIQSSNGTDNAFTSENITCYFISVKNEYLKKGIEMLSYFFNTPKFYDDCIKSECTIINSEHQKNITSDLWICDDLFKLFIKKPSKYTNFGTGNIES